MDAVLGRLQAGENERRRGAGGRARGRLAAGRRRPAIDDLRELTGERLPDADEHDYNTIAGLMIAHFGRIPHVGEYFELGAAGGSRWSTWTAPRIDKLLLQRMPDRRPRTALRMPEPGHAAARGRTHARSWTPCSTATRRNRSTSTTCWTGLGRRAFGMFLLFVAVLPAFIPIPVGRRAQRPADHAWSPCSCWSAWAIPGCPASSPGAARSGQALARFETHRRPVAGAAGTHQSGRALDGGAGPPARERLHRPVAGAAGLPAGAADAR